MPIYEAQGSLILHFGVGYILISTGRNMEKTYEDEIVFALGGTGVINESTDKLAGKDSQAIGAPVRMIFEKTESIDVLIDKLLQLKDSIRNAIKPEVVKPAAAIEESMGPKNLSIGLPSAKA